MHRPIMIVGEFWTEAESISGKPFDGGNASILFGLLDQVGITPEEVFLTNVINKRPPGNRLEGLMTTKTEAIPGYRAVFGAKYLHQKYQPELDRLEAEINLVQPNVIVAMGNLSLWALCKKTGIKKYRGAPLYDHTETRKVIPTWPVSTIQRQWEMRVITLADLEKAKRQSTFPEIHRPERFIHIEPSLSDIEEFYQEYLADSPFLGCDIETKQRTITEVGYSTADGSRALVIPFYSRTTPGGNYWPSLAEEVRAWGWVQRINEEKPLVGQNFSYDMKYFWKTVGIPCPKFLDDTMLLHHSLQPEMEKSLGFLGSIYTDEPSWKFMRKDVDNAKQGDE